jgi:hypothetical protein
MHRTALLRLRQNSRDDTQRRSATGALDEAVGRDRRHRVADVGANRAIPELGDVWDHDRLLATMRAGDRLERLVDILKPNAVREVDDERPGRVDDVALHPLGDAGQRGLGQRSHGANAEPGHDLVRSYRRSTGTESTSR